jgi:DNA (cytosine-5)-methyltransferase 1
LAAVEVDIMIANAVPVHLAEVLADCIVDYEVKREVSLEKDFRAWVRETQCYTDRSAGNVVSRLNRVRKLIGPMMRFHDTPDAVRALEKVPEFSRFSSSVRSQLKRAIYLHSEFARRM